MTRAPPADALALVSSVDPSSTTRISCHDPALRRSPTTDAIDVASLNAGMTMDVAAPLAIGHQFRDHPVPGDGACAIVARIAKAARAHAVGREPRDGRADRLGRRLGDETGDTVFDE